jgi:hypothetical protein
VNEVAVAEAVEELAAMMRADGAKLSLVTADPKTARIEVSLDLDGVDCMDCVLAPDFLEQMLTESLRKSVRGEFELVLHDPRR